MYYNKKAWDSVFAISKSKSASTCMREEPWSGIMERDRGRIMERGYGGAENRPKRKKPKRKIARHKTHNTKHKTQNTTQNKIQHKTKQHNKTGKITKGGSNVHR